MENRTDGDGITEALNELIADVSNLKVREYQYVGMSCDGTTRCLLFTYRRNESSICLQLTVNLQFRIEFLSQLRSLDDLVYHLVGSTALG